MRHCPANSAAGFRFLSSRSPRNPRISCARWWRRQEVRVRLLYLLSERLFRLPAQVEVSPLQREGTILGKQCPPETSYDRFSNHSLHLRRSRAGRTHSPSPLELHLAACINILP